MMKITLAAVAAAAAMLMLMLTTAPLATPPKASRWPKSMFRSDGTETTATIGTVEGGGTTPTLQLASARVVSQSAHDSAAAW
jgi:hypothetical protein